MYRLVFAPLQPHLGTATRLFLSPDGQLNLVPWATLHDGTRYLLDTFDIRYLTSGKDLLPRPAGLDIKPTAPVIFADPDFGTREATASRGAAQATSPSARDRSFALDRFDREQGTALHELPWLALPGTRQEAMLIAERFPSSRIYLGTAATAEALFQVAAPRFLHLATHGRYLQDTTSPSAPHRSRAPRTTIKSVGEPPAPPADPMLRSMLLLAGAKLVTALELANLNLWGTELVVLSACETGQGDVQTGQGVYGLRRAFTIAGAQTVVTSLWRVDDAVTQTLMGRFYQGLAQGQAPSQAMRDAMHSVRANPQTAHPRYWAPFIVSGNDAPLRGLGRPAPIIAPR